MKDSGTRSRFSRWLEKQAAQLVDPLKSLPKLDELSFIAGLPDKMQASLSALIAQGVSESNVVAAVIYIFLQDGLIDAGLPRDTVRLLRGRLLKQVSGTLAAKVGFLIRQSGYRPS
ncbi:MAG: hypothetical protein HC889_02245 [Synechococcaceae cyanobacterium SM1_2_3]|nr:hypothetical protein [Synechococcaceae cyanobacterium SM1_2_3]